MRVLITRAISSLLHTGLLYALLTSSTLNAAHAEAPPTFHWKESTHALNFIQRDLVWLEDPAGELTLEEIETKEHEFVPLGRETSVGFTESTVWLRFDFTNDSPEHERFILAADYRFYDLLEFFALSSGGKV